MFCSQCGTELPNEAKFCPSCGFRLAGSQADCESPQQSSKVSVEILGETFYFSSKIGDAGRLYNEFHDMADKKVSVFMRNMTFTYGGSLDTFIARANEDVNSLFNDFYQKTLDYLIGCGIYTCDVTQIKKAAESYCVLWPDFYQNICTAYHTAEQKAQNEMDYRAERKENRGRVIGGGFGFGAAMKGMAEAAAINAATGAAHSIINTVGNVATFLNLVEKKNQIFENQEFRNQLRLSLYHDCTHIYYALIDLYNATFETDSLPCYSDQSFLGAASVQEKLIKGEIPTERVSAAVVGMLKTFPLSPAFYKTAEQVLPESREDLHRLAECCGFIFHDELDNQECNLDRLAIRLCGNPFFVDNAAILGKGLLSALPSIIESRRAILGKRIWFVSEEDVSYPTIKQQVQPDEIPVLFWDRAISKSKMGTGQDGLILTDKAIYAHMVFGGFTRTPLERLDLYIQGMDIYLSKEEYDEWKIYGNGDTLRIDKCTVFCEDINGKFQDGTVANSLLNFIVDILLYQRTWVSHGSGIVEEICARAGFSLDECRERVHSTDNIEGIDERTKRIDEIVSYISGNCFTLIQNDTTEYNNYFFLCGSACPPKMREPIKELLISQPSVNIEEEIELLFCYSTLKKMDNTSTLLTNKAMYLFPSSGERSVIPLNELKSLEVRKKMLSSYIYANSTIKVPIYLFKKEGEEFCHDMMERILPFLIKG